MIRIITFQQRAGGGASGAGGGPSGMPRWASWLAMAGSLIVGATLFLVAASLALILIPVVAVGAAIAYWRIKARLKAAGFGEMGAFSRRRTEGGAEIIDAEYRVIEPGERQPH